jgi:hypothetical protein
VLHFPFISCVPALSALVVSVSVCSLLLLSLAHAVKVQGLLPLVSCASEAEVERRVSLQRTSHRHRRCSLSAPLSLAAHGTAQSQSSGCLFRHTWAWNTLSDRQNRDSHNNNNNSNEGGGTQTRMSEEDACVKTRSSMMSWRSSSPEHPFEDGSKVARRIRRSGGGCRGCKAVLVNCSSP